MGAIESPPLLQRHAVDVHVRPPALPLPGLAELALDGLFD